MGLCQRLGTKSQPYQHQVTLEPFYLAVKNEIEEPR